MWLLYVKIGRSWLGRPLLFQLRIHKKSLKWWRKLNFWIVEVSFVNSFHLVYLHNCQQNRNNTLNFHHKTYRKHVISGLFGQNLNTMKRGRTSGTNNELRIQQQCHTMRAFEWKEEEERLVFQANKKRQLTTAQPVHVNQASTPLSASRSNIWKGTTYSSDW